MMPMIYALRYAPVCLSITAWLFLASAVLSDDTPAAPQPGRLVLLTNPGYVPTVTSLFSDISFAAVKSYQSWTVRPLMASLGYKEQPSKASGDDLAQRLFVLTFPDTIDVREVLGRLQGRTGIQLVEPDYRLQLFSWPTDSLFVHQWYFRNTGQPYYAIKRLSGSHNDTLYLNAGVPGEDVNLGPIYDHPPADSVEVLVAIIDTGVDDLHADLADNIYHNPGEIPGNGLDDDHNGFIDDDHGWDFSGDTLDVLNYQGDNDPADYMGHGTHLAGLVGAVHNQIGIAGYPGKIKILPIKIFPLGFGSLAAAGIIYAVDMGARVINMSWGYPFESNILREALRYAEAKGCLPVAAAGNFGDSRRVYPAAYPEAFTVGGTDSDGYLTYFTSFGPFVDIVAPARDILSLRAAGTDLYAPDEAGLRIIDSLYILADGTSMAAPLVAGAAAMLWSFYPDLDLDRIRLLLCQSADDLVDPFGDSSYLPGYDTLSGWGRLNAGRAFDLVGEPSAYIRYPQANQVVGGRVVVAVGTTGGFIGPADLELGEGKNPEVWAPLYHAETVSATDTFFLWDSGLRSGYYSLRLTTPYGGDRVDVRLVNGRQVAILSPLDLEEIKYLVPIKGNIYGPGYDSVAISYRAEQDSVLHTLCSRTGLYFSETIYEWPVLNLAGGRYLLTMAAFFGDTCLADSISVTVRSLMRPGFPQHLPKYAAFSPGVADIDGDGRQEIVVGCMKGVYAFEDDGTLLPGFPVASDRDMRSLPAFDDIDGDGLPDIVISGNDLLGCYNYLGQTLPGWPKNASTGQAYYSYPIPTLTQLFDRRDSVIVYMSKFGEVRAYRYNGDSYFYSMGGLFTALDPNIFDTVQFVGLSVPFVTAADLDHNGVNEVVAVYSTAQESSGIYIWNSRNGLAPFGWSAPLARKIGLSHGGSLADLDEDGTLDIIMAGLDTNRTVGIWATRNGRENLPGWPVQLEGLSDWQGTAPVCVDIDNDGYKEVVVAYYNFDIGRVYAFNRDGTPYGVNPGNPSGALLNVSTTLSNLIVADIDGNGLPNLISRGGYIFPGSGYERIYAWEPNGEITPGFPIVTPTSPSEVVSSLFTPVVADLENDGRVELISCGDAGDLFVWNMDAPYHPGLMMWPKFDGDGKNSGINHHLGTPTDVPGEAVSIASRFAIANISPNPFNPAARVTFTLDRSEGIRLDVYNILGQRVTTLASGRYSSGQHSVVWDGTDASGQTVASGVYIARLVGQDRQTSRKMVLVR